MGKAREARPRDRMGVRRVGRSLYRTDANRWRNLHSFGSHQEVPKDVSGGPERLRKTERNWPSKWQWFEFAPTLLLLFMFRSRWAMPPLFDKAAITFGHLRRRFAVATIADRARCARLPARASIGNSPRPIQVGLADPACIVAAWTQHYDDAHAEKFRTG
jgi:hypothetical protein